MKSNAWAAIALVFLIWAIGTSAGLAYYYQANQNQEKIINSLESIVDSTTMRVNIGINYGNGTIAWHNGTYVPLGANAFNSTLKIATLNYTVSPFGTFVTGINGVMQNFTSMEFWLFYSWQNGTKIQPQVGATEYVLANGETITWELEKFSL